VTQISDCGHVAERSRRDGCQRNQDNVGVLSVQMHVDSERRSITASQTIFVLGICLRVSLNIIC